MQSRQYSPTPPVPSPVVSTSDALRLMKLAEAIILQAVKDLWNAHHREESVAFFMGEGFQICSELAGMDSGERERFLHMLTGTVLNDGSS